MRITTTVLVFLFVAGTLLADFETSLMKTGLEFITRPNDFFIELNTDTENLIPTPGQKKFQVNTSLIWDLLTVGNIQVKYRAYKGDSVIPEITPGFSYWNIVGLSFLPAEDVSASAEGYTPFLTLARPMSDDLKFFGGIKYTMGSIKLNIKDIGDSGSGGTGLDFSNLAQIDSFYQELGIYAGINYLRISGKEVSAIIGYYPGIKKIFSKVQISSTVFDYGLSFFPDSFLLLHGYINIHVNL
ncbi:MAG: hypothetical protein PHF84_12905 [bacterium]|nr:hypothetical protein [bacterium]